MKIKKVFALTLTLIMVTSLFGVLPVAADSAAVIDGATAAGRCSTSYPGGPFGPDQLSPCQWDMGVIHSDASHAYATGAGVKVGVIDGGVDFTHPDLAGAIDVAKSCSFIYSTTPTA